MNKLFIYTLKALRKVYAKSFGHPDLISIYQEKNPDKASEIIYNLLVSNKPCMIARFGATELSCIHNYLSIKAGDKCVLKYIKGETFDWWWNPNIMAQMQNWSGFFPPTEDKLEQFCELMLEDIKELDLFGSWLPDEFYLNDYFNGVDAVSLHLLEPFWSNTPWTRALEGKKVLVIHPFAQLIEQQYHNKRTELFSNNKILPLFNLQTIQAVQSLGGESNDFNDWFEALRWMEQEIDKKDFDICLIGCGAYGFPLAAYIKQMGKKAIHIGGVLQILFGIKGKRWERKEYGVKEWGIPYGFYSNMMNSNWVSPEEDFCPQNANKVEGGCYW